MNNNNKNNVWNNNNNNNNNNNQIRNYKSYNRRLIRNLIRKNNIYLIKYRKQLILLMSQGNNYF
jgi:hypothetical protein